MNGRRLAGAWMTLACASIAAARAAPSTAPASQPDIADRIRAALQSVGNVDALAAELNRSATDTVTSWADRAAVAQEQGDLVAARTALEAIMRLSPRDPDAAGRLAYVQELLGDTRAAMTTLDTLLTAQPKAPAAFQARLRLALLDFDAGRSEEAVRQLQEAVDRSHAAATPAGLIAAFYGRHAAAARWLKDSIDPHLLLLAGDEALQDNDAAAATLAYARAAPELTTPADRRYLVERQFAAARIAGTLPQYADALLGTRPLPAEAVLPLVGVLHEQKRLDLLLSFWRTALDDPNLTAAATDRRVVREIIAAAADAGRPDDVTALCEALLARDPTNRIWFETAVRAAADAGRLDEQHRLLITRLARVTDSPDDLLWLGDLAAEVGDLEIVVSAADRLRNFGAASTVAGDSLRATVLTRQGDAAGATVALNDAADVALRHPALISDVAATVADAGLTDRAIELLSVSAVAGDDDIRMRLAALLLQQKRPAEAIATLDALRRETQSAATRSQAGQRMLDAAVGAHSINALIVRLRHDSDDGIATPADVELLVDAYVRASEPKEAEAVLLTSVAFTEPARLQHLATFYLRRHQPAKAEVILRQLLTADLQTKATTLRQIASIALQLHDAAGAADALRQLRELNGNSLDTDAMTAGMLYQLGQAGEAATLYRRVLASRPNDVDDWLLWADARAKADDAVLPGQRLQLLAGEAATPALFAVAVDGMLNLGAPPDALQAARRQAVLRVAGNPGDPLVFGVIADLCDELKDGEFATRVTRIAVPLLPQQRGQFLRDLMETAIRSGRSDAAAAYGRSLLALGDDYPPQLFFDLGEQLLIAGRRDDAMRAFARAADVTSEEDAAPRAAELLEKYGDPAAALALVGPLARRRPDDPLLLARVGREEELLGHSDAAFTANLAALALTMHDTSTPIADTIDPATGGPGDDLPYEDLLNATIATARTPTAADGLLSLLSDTATTALSRGDPDGGVPAEVRRAAAALRQAAISLDALPRSDAVDLAIARRWPADKSYLFKMATVRWNAGLTTVAVDFARASGQADVIPPDDATTGRPAIDAAIAHVPDDRADVMPIRLAAAAALHDDAAVMKLTTAWIDAIIVEPAAGSGLRPMRLGRPRVVIAQPATEQIRDAVSTAWPVLSATGRKAVAARLIDLASLKTDAGRLGALSEEALRRATETGVAVIDRATLVDRAIQTPGTRLNGLVGLLSDNELGTAVTQVVDAAPPFLRLSAVRSVVADRGVPMTRGVVTALIRACADPQSNQALGSGTWPDRPVSNELAAAWATAAVHSLGAGTPESLTLVAEVLHAANDPRCDAFALRAIVATHAASIKRHDAPGAVPRLGPPPLDKLAIVRRAVAAMSRDGRDRLIDTTATADEEQGWQLLCRGVALDALGGRGEALTTLRKAWAANPASEIVARGLADHLQSDGRFAELVDTFLPVVDRLPVLRPQLIASLRQLYRVHEAQRIAVPVPNVAEPPDLIGPVRAGDAKAAAIAVRSTLATLRDGDSIDLSFAMPDAGGMTGRPASAADLLPPGTDIIGDLHAMRVVAKAQPQLSVAAAWAAHVAEQLHVHAAVTTMAASDISPTQPGAVVVAKALRDAIARRDFSSVEHELQDWCDAQAAVDDHNAAALIDILPNAPSDGEEKNKLVAILINVIQSTHSTKPGKIGTVRLAAMFGDWAQRQGMNDLAVDMAARADNWGSALGLGAYQLWAADLLAATGRADAATAIEKRLLAERCLPAPRVLALLKRLAESGPATRVIKVGTEALDYCPDPALAVWLNEQRKKEIHD